MTVIMTISTEYLKTYDACVGVQGQKMFLILDTCVTHLRDVFFLWNKWVSTTATLQFELVRPIIWQPCLLQHSQSHLITDRLAQVLRNQY
jgi:hypothetical protein